jgi:hypothetical protein
MKYPDVLNELEKQARLAAQMTYKPTTPKEQSQFKQKYPWADLVVGDFQIRVINREKYGFDPQ